MRIFITTLITGVVLVWLQKLTQKREKESCFTEEKFLIKLSTGYFWIGLVEAGMIMVIVLGGTLSKEFSAEVTFVTGMVGIPGILLMVFPLSGMWEILVDDDDITVTKAVVFKKHFLFSDIVRCKQKRGGWKVYVKGQKRKAFFVDLYMDGSGLFLKRAQKAGITMEKMQIKG